MTPLAIKICGLSTPETLEAAIAAGADMVGFVFFPKSPRHLTLDTAADLATIVRGRAKIVALIVDADDEEIERIIEAARPDMLQLHGHETAQRVADIRARFGLPVMKALGVADATDVVEVALYRPVADHLLLDAKPPRGADLPGGNGLSFDWRLLAALDPGLPFMLSGGLTPDNVAQAVSLTRCTGIDVSSGVESAPGAKDSDLIKAFIEAARAADAARNQNKDAVA